MALIEREKALIVAKYIRTGSVTTIKRWVNTMMQKHHLHAITSYIGIICLW